MLCLWYAQSEYMALFMVINLWLVQVLYESFSKFLIFNSHFPVTTHGHHLVSGVNLKKFTELWSQWLGISLRGPPDQVLSCAWRQMQSQLLKYSASLKIRGWIKVQRKKATLILLFSRCHLQHTRVLIYHPQIFCMQNCTSPLYNILE